MKPILILQNANNDWPDYFEDFLAGHNRPYVVVNRGQNHSLPHDLSGFSGFALMGGAMGANDEDSVPHLTDAYRLLQQALKQRIPVIGHCLGGQMLAKAIGAQVKRADTAEVGWHTVKPAQSLLAQEWLGSAPFFAMQWHYDTFAMPNGAVHLATSDFCPNQAFLFDGIHLGMQFHIEAQAEKIECWMAEVRSSLSVPNGRNIQSDEQIRQGTQARLDGAKAMARSLYQRWLRGVDTRAEGGNS